MDSDSDDDDDETQETRKADEDVVDLHLLTGDKGKGKAVDQGDGRDGKDSPGSRQDPEGEKEKVEGTRDIPVENDPDEERREDIEDLDGE